MSLQPLPPDFLAAVLRRLSLPDRLRFAAVCSSFRSASLLLPPPPLVPHLPFLILYPSSLFNLHESRHYRNFPNLPDDHLVLSSNSSSSSLVLSVSTSHQLHLLRPFSKIPSLTPLPPLFPSSATAATFQNLIWIYFKAAVVRSTVVVILMHPPKLAFLRHGLDRRWKAMGSSPDPYYDLAVLKDSIFTLTFAGKVEMWEVKEDGIPRVKLTVPEVKPSAMLEMVFVERYLVAVEGEGEVLQVWRWMREVRIRVFKLDIKRKRWVEMQGLGDWVLFLSHAKSMAVNANDFEGLRRNCIYCCHKEGEVWECSVYDLAENGRQRFYEPQKDMRPPIWIMPSLDQ